MLVLSRRPDEKVVFPTLGVSVRVLRSSSSNVRLGIEAPRDICVLRGELAEQQDLVEAMVSKVHDNSGQHLKKTEFVRSKVHEAATTLNRLHGLAERAKWSIAEKSIFQMFGQLKSIDDELAELARGFTPNQTTAPNQAVNSKSKPTNKKRLNGNARALLVDDNDNESRLLSSYLRIKGVDVTLASNGKEAIQHLEKESPDVVLLDMNMPEFDGRWTIDRIRDNRNLDNLTVFAVSGTAATESDVEVGPRGVNSWFRKPLNPENLVSAITKQLSTSLACAN